MQKSSPRVIATQILLAIFNKNVSLNTALKNNQQNTSHRDQAFIQELCYGVMRWYWQLDAIAQLLLTKSMKNKDNDIYILLLLGLYQLLHLNTPAHAAINETVEATRKLKKPWASGLLNAILRKFQREKPSILNSLKDNPAAVYSHPDWLIQLIKGAWPMQWQNILQSNNAYPPLTLRVNTAQISREKYSEKLIAHSSVTKTFLQENQTIEDQINDEPPHVLTTYSTFGITLAKPCDVKQLPGFSEGEFSVQDESAQLAATLLQLQSNQFILDACAAPGGKTTHILEVEPYLKNLLIIDVDAIRLEKIKENIKRLKLDLPAAIGMEERKVTLMCADAAKPDIWWHGEQFDRILLDAPCSATGVIRRHPDIKFLRRAEDIAQLARQQLALLHALWPLLTTNGLLVYATCSVLPQENESVLIEFLKTHPDAKEKLIAAEWGLARNIGRQLLPQNNGHDGFYYAVLQKAASSNN